MSAGSRFDRTAERYAAMAAARDWTGLVGWCEPAPADRALDVAGGPGSLAAALLPRGGVDHGARRVGAAARVRPGGDRARAGPGRAAAVRRRQLRPRHVRQQPAPHRAPAARARRDGARARARRADRARGLHRRRRSRPGAPLGGDRAHPRPRARPADHGRRAACAAARGRPRPGCRGDVASPLRGRSVAGGRRVRRLGRRARARADRRARRSSCACGAPASGGRS